MVAAMYTSEHVGWTGEVQVRWQIGWVGRLTVHEGR